MPARPLPNLLLEAFFALGEDGWNDEFDRNMLKLSVLVQSGVSGKFAAEPGAPAAGTIIVLDEDHATHPNAIGVFDDGEWVYFLPNKGWLTYDQTEDVYLTFNGTLWAVLETGGGGGGGIPEAPADGKQYARQDEAWSEVEGGAGALYRFGGFFTVTPAADETVMMHVATDGFTIPANLAGTVVDVGVNPDANTILSLYRNGVGIGSITVSAAGAVTLAGTGATVAAGDLLTLEAPADSNGLAEVAFTFRGEGAVIGAISGGGLAGITRVHRNADFNVATGAWRPVPWDAVDDDTLDAHVSLLAPGDATNFTVPEGVTAMRVSALIGWQNGVNAPLVTLVNATTAYSLPLSLVPAQYESINAVVTPWIDVTPGDEWFLQVNAGANTYISGTAGDHFGSPSRLQFEWVGSVNDLITTPGGGGGGGSVADLGAWSTNLPLAADLDVKVNGTATADLIESTQGVHVDFTVVGNYRGVFLGRECPAAPFVAVARVGGHFGFATEAGIGMALKDGGSDKIITMSRNTGDGNTYVQRWNSPNTYGGNLNNMPVGGVGGGYTQFEPIWMAIGVAADGAVTTFVSNNGVTWTPRAQENVSAFLGTAGAVGLHAFCNNTDGVRMYPTLHYFDIIEGVAVPPNLFPRV